MPPVHPAEQRAEDQRDRHGDADQNDHGRNRREGPLHLQHDHGYERNLDVGHYDVLSTVCHCDLRAGLKRG